MKVNARIILVICLLQVQFTLAKDDNVPNWMPGSSIEDSSPSQGNQPSSIKSAGVAGDVLLLPIKEGIRLFRIALFGPLFRPALVLGAKATVIAFITAEIMAYLGIIGDQGEGLYEWAVENETRVHAWIEKWGMRPGGFLRKRLEIMLIGYKNLPSKSKFASSVSVGVTMFPLVVKTTVWLGAVSVVVFLVAELLAFMGVLGDPGEGLSEWVKDGDAEPLLHTFRTFTEQTRAVLRKKLKLQELVSGFVTNLRDDQVFWIGFSVGAIASVVLPFYYDKPKPH